MARNSFLALAFLQLPFSSISLPFDSDHRDVRIIKGTRCSSRTKLNLDDDSLWPSVATDIDNGIELLPNCPKGYFCSLTSDPSGDTLGLCKPCLGGSKQCISEIYGDKVFLNGTFTEKTSAGECWEQCGPETNRCSSSHPCPYGLFCNPDGEGESDEGYCQACPYHIYNCAEQNLTKTGIDSCLASCAVSCHSSSSIVESSVSKLATTKERSLGEPLSFHGSPEMTATGPVVNCGLGLEPCEGAEGSICLIERGKAYFSDKVKNCYAGGGIGAIIFNIESLCGNFNGTLTTVETFIPSISLSHLDGKAILEKMSSIPSYLPLNVTISVGADGLYPSRCEVGCFDGKECEGDDMTCNFDNGEFGACESCVPTFENNFCQVMCDENTTCASDGLFCDYRFGVGGTCKPCPKETGQECFYSNLNNEGAKECAAVCANGESQELKTPPCKFCPKVDVALDDISDGSITSASEKNVVEPCQFCAMSATPTCSKADRWDMKYPHRTMRMFGSGAKCWVVAEFYRDLNIAATDPTCETARLFNHICGCSDSAGYAGAHTKNKQLALVWLPRVSAMLSLLGSLIMMIDVLSNKLTRKKVLGELIVALSAFDIVGSLAYAFTTLPTPEDDYIHGSRGSEASCKAQGFFIQIGTISSYINVSLAFYYLVTIRYAWREKKLRNSKSHHLLLVVPISIGIIFALAGIPYYDNMVLWCNNSGSYWPEIPIVVAILVATCVMGNLCWYVSKEERASKKWRQHSRRSINGESSLAMKFFWQSLYYLGAFYLTWPPYLALQFMLASGYAYSHYGFFLFAGTVVPLQGFWNFLVYSRTRKITASSLVSSVVDRVSTVGTAALGSSSKRFSQISFDPDKSSSHLSHLNEKCRSPSRESSLRDCVPCHEIGMSHDHSVKDSSLGFNVDDTAKDRANFDSGAFSLDFSATDDHSTDETEQDPLQESAISFQQPKSVSFRLEDSDCNVQKEDTMPQI